MNITHIFKGEIYDEWQTMYLKYKAAYPHLSAELEAGLKCDVPDDLLTRIPVFPVDENIATRKAGYEVLESVAVTIPNFITGSADLASSCLNYIDGGGDFSPENWTGRNIPFGIREHAMAGIMNGIAYDGIFRPSGSTFAVFSDYCRASIRVASISSLPVIYIGHTKGIKLLCFSKTRHILTCGRSAFGVRRSAFSVRCSVFGDKHEQLP